MPPIRSLVLAYYAFLATFIFLNNKIIESYFCCVRKGLVYIVITAPSGC